MTARQLGTSSTAALAVALALLVQPAGAMDCSKARTAVEKAICADPAARRADEAMQTAYDGLRRGLPAARRPALQLSQRRWLQRREYCEGGSAPEVAACARQRTEARAAFLAGRPASGPGPLRLVPLLVQKEGRKGGWEIDMNLLHIAEPASGGEHLFNTEVDALLAPALIESSTLGTATVTVEGDLPYAMGIDMIVTYASPHLISARADAYDYFGGAHGSGYMIGINIDVEGERRLGFGDLFRPEATDGLVAACQKEIGEEQAARGAAPDVGAVPDGELLAIIRRHVRDLARWHFTAGGATITFDSDVIGSHAEGSYECSLPLAMLKAAAVAGAVLPE